MRLMSTLTRVGLILLAGAMISVLGTSTVWDSEPPKEITTNDLANKMLDDWALPLLVLGILMAMAMMGAAYLFAMNVVKILNGNREVKTYD